jgi:cellulose synthase/poly-beta-1,6-N-acetylglucosamine synthase-like glycosyltransferase
VKPSPPRQAAFLAPLHSSVQKIEHLVASALWLAALVHFWGWWLQPAHYIGAVGFVLVSLVLAWATLLPLYFLAIFMNAKVPAPKLAPPGDLRVAMVVTKAPSEPFAVVEETLRAMLRQTLPHDTWLADEDPSPETLAWCWAHGVLVSTRKGRDDYHRKTWPRRTRCKEGNLAFFYDNYGYANYDVVAQLDADHVPAETYLEEIVKPFADPAVGYVSAPSICDKNADRSWSARGRLYVEGNLHGALQAGYTNGWAPLCIGSHYAVRTQALKKIGGLGPELAEDHSTTLMMNAHGWRGVHAMQAIAHGDGPNTFADLATQEFQWSRSLMMVLLKYSPRYVPMLPAKLKFQFVFAQLWYPLFSLIMAIAFAMPIGALLLDENFIDVTYVDFLIHFVPLSVVLILMAYRWKAARWMRPFDARVLSWEGMLFQFARWPWSLLGTLAALRDWVTGTTVEFRVTPKGSDTAGPLPFRVLAPYVFLTIASALPGLILTDVRQALGFYIFASANALIYGALLAVILIRHAKENGLPRQRRKLGAAALQGCVMLLLACVMLAGAARSGPKGFEAIVWGSEAVGVTKVTYAVAGAGQGGIAVRRLAFLPG